MNYLLLLIAVASAIASPLENELFQRQATTTPVCSKVATACSAPAQSRSAKAYCSSLLSLSTVTHTVADHTVTVAPSCTPITLKSHGFLPSSSSSESFAGLVTHVGERAAAATSPVPAPSCFSNAQYLSRVSSCGCFSYKTQTTNVKVATATQTGPFHVEASGGYESETFTDFYTPTGDLDFLYVIFYTGNETRSQPWIINQDKYLMLQGTHYAAVQVNAPKGNTPVFLSTTPFNRTEHTPLLRCSIEDSTCFLKCSDNLIYNKNYLCYGIDEWNLNVNPKYNQACRHFQPLVKEIAS